MSKVFLTSVNGSHTVEREYETTETVNDLKVFIIDYFKNMKITTSDSIRIIYNGKIVSENVPLRSLSDGDIFMKFIIKETLQLTRESEKIMLQTHCNINQNEIVNYTNKTEINNVRDNNNNDLIDEKRRNVSDNEKQSEIEMKKIENLASVRILKNGEKIFVDPSKIVTINKQLIYVTKREKTKTIIEDLRSVLVNLKMDLIIKIGVIIGLFLSGNYEFASILCAILFLRLLSNIKFKLQIKRSEKYGLKIICSFFITLLFYNSDQILDFSECKENKGANDNS